MKATEINLEKKGYNFNCNIVPARSHYKYLMKMGRVFPSTQAQAKYFITEKIQLSVLNYNDVVLVEKILNKHGFTGDYKYTKSGIWVRLQNHSDLHEALKSEFKL